VEHRFIKGNKLVSGQLRGQKIYKYSLKIINEDFTMDMFWTVVVILVVLWLLGLIGNIGGGLIHILLVIAAIVVLIRLIQGKNLVTG
jgi:hypothetical protein